MKKYGLKSLERESESQTREYKKLTKLRERIDFLQVNLNNGKFPTYLSVEINGNFASYNGVARFSKISVSIRGTRD